MRHAISLAQRADALDLSRAPHFNHFPDFSAGVLAVECAELLREVFRRRRRESAS